MSSDKDHHHTHRIASPRFAADTNFETPSTAEHHSFSGPTQFGEFGVESDAAKDISSEHLQPVAKEIAQASSSDSSTPGNKHSTPARNAKKAQVPSKNASKTTSDVQTVPPKHCDNLSEYDLYGDQINCREWLYDDDLSVESLESSLAPKARPDTEGGKKNQGPSSAYQSVSQRLGEDPLHAGLGRGQSYRPGVGPSTDPENDGSEVLRSESSSTRVVCRPSSEVPHAETHELDPTLGGRIAEEVKERPVFEGGHLSATGKYEAVFEPIIGPEAKQERTNFPMAGEQSMGKYEAVYYPESTSAAGEARVTGLQEEKYRQAKGFDNKPISDNEKAEQVEGHEASEKFCIN